MKNELLNQLIAKQSENMIRLLELRKNSEMLTIEIKEVIEHTRTINTIICEAWIEKIDQN